MELIFLGTSAMVPTKDRNHTSILLRYKADNILVDCGEGTQRQLKKASIPLPSVTKLLITHWDGDHVLGIPGLLQSLAASEYNKVLMVFGPKHTKSFFSKLTSLFKVKDRINIKVQEVTSGKFFENDDYLLEAQSVNHTSPTLAYAFVEKDKRRVDKAKMKKFKVPEGPLVGKLVGGKPIELNGKKISPEKITFVQKGKKIAFVMDSAFTKDIVKLAKDSDLLVCESTYGSELEDKALEYKHMTSSQAAQIASLSSSKQLILTHFSARYKSTASLENDAKKIFPSTKAAVDFMKVNF